MACVVGTARALVVAHRGLRRVVAGCLAPGLRATGPVAGRSGATREESGTQDWDRIPHIERPIRDLETVAPIRAGRVPPEVP